MVRPLEPVDPRLHSLKTRNTTKGTTCHRRCPHPAKPQFAALAQQGELGSQRSWGLAFGMFLGWCKNMIPMKRSTHCSSFTDSGLAACAGRQNASPAFVPSGSDRGGWEGLIAMNAKVMDSVRFGSCSLMFQT